MSRPKVARRSYRFKRCGSIKGRYWIRRNIRKLKRRRLGVVFGQIFITFQRRNTFVNLSSRKKVLATISAGILQYKGRKKASPVVRELLGSQIAAFAKKSYYRLVDINFVAKTGRFYRFVLKGIAKQGLIIRLARVRQIHPHGFMRPRRKRRV